MAGKSPADRRTLQPLPDLLALLVRDIASGILQIKGRAGTRNILMVDGEIRAAGSSLETEKIGSWLVAQELISENQRTQALRVQHQTSASEPLGFFLVKELVLTRMQLQKELEELGLTIIRRASADLEALAVFTEDADLEQPDTLGSLPTGRLILESCRSFPDFLEKKHQLGSTKQLIGVAGDIITLSTDLNLSTREAFLLSRIDNIRKIDDLIHITPMPERQALEIIYSLSRCGLLRIGPPRKLISLSPAQQKISVEARRIVDEEQLDAELLHERREIQDWARTMSQLDHYQVLRLRRDAPFHEINEAWRKMDQALDPARSSEPHLLDMESTLEAVRERAQTAHELLSNPPSRRRYDRILMELAKSAAKDKSGREGTDAGVRTEMVEANIKRADELIHDGEIYLAIQLLEQACALEPRPSELVKLARLMLRNPLWHRRAQRCLRTALDVDPNYVEGWVELAEFWRRKNNRERHRKALERALTIDPRYDRALKMYEQLVGTRELQQFLTMSHLR